MKRSAAPQRWFFRFYQVLWLLLPPLLSLGLHYKGRRTPAYRQYKQERFGKPLLAPVKHCIWIHAVSLGETIAAQKIIEGLRENFPNTPFLITQMTPTGRQAAQKLYPFAQCRYLPYDKDNYVRQFLSEHQPTAALFMETEIWANYLVHLHKNHIPSFLLNARLSDKSYLGYQRLASLLAPLISYFSVIFAQDQASADRFRQLGAQQVMVVGNSKQDITIKEEDRARGACFARHKQNLSKAIVIAASTRSHGGVNEAFLLLDVWRSLHHQAVLLIVPRHPESFAAVYDYACALGFNTVKRTDQSQLNDDVEVIVGDSMGELMSYYLNADIAFVGGSLVDTGCQNVIEPIRCGLPTLFGYSTYNFQSSCALALKVACAKQVFSSQEWKEEVEHLLTDHSYYAAMKQNTALFFAQESRASELMVKKITAKLIQS